MERSIFLELRLGTARLGIPLAEVERVLRAAAVVPVSGAPDCLLGMLDLGGEATPVYDTRRLLGLQSRPLHPDDRFVLVRDGTRRAVFVADEVPGVVETEAVPPASFAIQSAGVRGVAAGPDGLLLVQDLARFLLLERAVRIAHA